LFNLGLFFISALGLKDPIDIISSLDSRDLLIRMCDGDK